MQIEKITERVPAINALDVFEVDAMMAMIAVENLHPLIPENRLELEAPPSFSTC